MIVLALAVATVYLFNKKTAFMQRVQSMQEEEQEETSNKITEYEDKVHTLPSSSDITRQFNSKNVDAADYNDRLPQGQLMQIKKMQDAALDTVAAYEGTTQIEGVMLHFDNI